MNTENNERKNNEERIGKNINNFLKSIYSQYLGSLDSWFIFIGIILTGFSLIMSFLYGHMIAGIILVVCEVLLIGVYVLKLV